MMSEIIHPFKPLKQQSPSIVSGGDCGACVIGGILNLDINKTYSILGKVDNVTYNDIISLFTKENYEIETSLPAWEEWYDENITNKYLQFYKPSWRNSLRWFELTKKRLTNGFIGIVSVNFNEEGYKLCETDHWALLVGFEEFYKNVYDENGIKLGEVRVDNIIIECSVKGTKKYEKEYFLKHLGGYNGIFIKIKH